MLKKKKKFKIGDHVSFIGQPKTNGTIIKIETMSRWPNDSIYFYGIFSSFGHALELSEKHKNKQRIKNFLNEI